MDGGLTAIGVPLGQPYPRCEDCLGYLGQAYVCGGCICSAAPWTESPYDLDAIPKSWVGVPKGYICEPFTYDGMPGWIPRAVEPNEDYGWDTLDVCWSYEDAAASARAHCQLIQQPLERVIEELRAEVDRLKSEYEPEPLEHDRDDYLLLARNVWRSVEQDDRLDDIERRLRRVGPLPCVRLDRDLGPG